MATVKTGTMVETHDLAKSYKRADGEPVWAVKGIDLQIRQGEIFSLLGPNGAGKTTVISMISGLIAPTRGEARIGGFSITAQPMEAKRLLGVIPQDIALYPTLSARQNLEFFGKMYGLGGATLKKRVDTVLDFIDLFDKQNEKVQNFSGGMKRRVNIGVGLLHEPKLLYMDEPTVGIDPQNRRRILDTVTRLRDEMGVTVLYTSHLMEEVQAISDCVGIIDHGEIIALGTVGELIQRVGEEDRLVFDVGAQTVPPSLIEAMGRVEGVSEVRYETASAKEAPSSNAELPGGAPGGSIIVQSKRGRSALPMLIQIANDTGINILSIAVREPNLEAVFLSMTGRALRDG